MVEVDAGEILSEYPWITAFFV